MWGASRVTVGVSVLCATTQPCITGLPVRLRRWDSVQGSVVSSVLGESSHVHLGEGGACVAAVGVAVQLSGNKTVALWYGRERLTGEDRDGA